MPKPSVKSAAVSVPGSDTRSFCEPCPCPGRSSSSGAVGDLQQCGCGRRAVQPNWNELKDHIKRMPALEDMLGAFAVISENDGVKR